MKRPSVQTKCVANQYAADNERIVEFSSDCGGGLIDFYQDKESGKLHVTVYRHDETVIVKEGKR